MNYKKLLIFSFGLLLFGCTNLEEDLGSDLNRDQANEIQDVASLLATAYQNLNTFQAENRVWALMQHSTDETIGPTRGTDWDDNGVWRVLHDHTWDADHAYITDTYAELLEGVFNATNVLNFSPAPQQEAEARFLRAFYSFYVNDLWGQLPVREPGESLLNAPTVLNEVEAIEFIISELEAALPNLPDAGAPGVATKDAARAMLCKAYLQKGVYGNRANPSFDNADMEKVIEYADAISGYSLADRYFTNFIPSNDGVSNEIIFASQNVRADISSGNVRARWLCTIHYNQKPGGWNGFTTISEFYDKFEDDDTRLSFSIDSLGLASADSISFDPGFLIGQQFDVDGVTPLEDRNGNPLAFTPEVSLFETGNDLELSGIRAVKYIPDIDPAGNEFAENDYVLLRYADVLLMKAEALLRSGMGGADQIVNDLRDLRGASMLGSVNLDAIIDERGRELWWEGHRRTDLIRFGKFLEAYTEKPATDATKLVYPIPTAALAVNPNLTQNQGY